MNQAEHDRKRDCPQSKASTNGVDENDCSVGRKPENRGTKGGMPKAGGTCKRRPEAAREL